MVQYVVTVEVTLEAETPSVATAAVEMALWNLKDVRGTKFSVEQGYVPMNKLSDQQILDFKIRAGKLHNQLQHTWIMGAQPKPRALVLADKKFKDLFHELERRGYDAMDSSIEERLVKKVV